MPSFANVSLKNAAGVESVFAPRSNIGGWWQWIRELGGAAIANPVLTQKSTLPVSPDGRALHEFFLTFPRVDAPTAVPGAYAPNPRTVARNKVYIRVETSGLTTVAEKQELTAALADLTIDSLFKAIIEQSDLVRG